MAALSTPTCRALALILMSVAVSAVTATAQTPNGRARARDLGVKPGVFAPGANNAITDVSRRARRPDDGRPMATRCTPGHGHPAARRQPVSRSRARGAPRRQRVRKAHGQHAGQGARRARDADSAHVHAVRVEGGRRDGRVDARAAGHGARRFDQPCGWRDERRWAERHSLAAHHAGRTCVPRWTARRAGRWRRAASALEQGLRRSGGRVESARRRASFRSRSAARRSACSCRRTSAAILQVLGAPVGKELGHYAFKNDVEHERGDGSIVMVVATDAPLSDRNLERLAARAMMGLGRTGSSASNGSGDFVIAFSTAPSVRRSPNAGWYGP